MSAFVTHFALLFALLRWWKPVDPLRRKRLSLWSITVAVGAGWAVHQLIPVTGAIGIVALHDLNLAARYADHLLLIGSGQILAQGKLDAVLSDPLIAATYDVSIQTGLGPRKELNVHAYSD